MQEFISLSINFFEQNFLFCLAIVLIMLSLSANTLKVRGSRKLVETEFKKAIQESSEQISLSISPRIVYCASIEQVRNEAAGIISEASEEYNIAVTKNAKLLAEGSEKREDISQYFVTIYGAASLFNKSEAGDGLKDIARELSIEEYNKAIIKASDTKLQFRRYISLINEEELVNRSINVVNEYVEWLTEQHKSLLEDSNYTLIESPRAPQWGSSNTSIIANPGIIEIKGHGRSAFAIYDRRIAFSLRTSLRSDIYDSLPQNRREINCSNADSIEWLSSKLEHCRKVATEMQKP